MDGKGLVFSIPAFQGPLSVYFFCFFILGTPHFIEKMLISISNKAICLNKETF